MSKYSLNKTECIACGLCQVKAPKFLDYDDEGIVTFKIKNQNHIETNDKSMEEAFKKCPVHAILKH